MTATIGEWSPATTLTVYQPPMDVPSSGLPPVKTEAVIPGSETPRNQTEPVNKNWLYIGIALVILYIIWQS